MCKNHNKANGKEAIQALTEARHDKDVCADRIAYLEGRVKDFIQWLNSQNKDGKGIALGIHKQHLKQMEEDVFGEFIWTTMREHGPNLISTTAGLDDLESRMDDEHKCHSDYWGQAHRIAYQAFMKTINDETPYGRQVFTAGLKVLDKVEERFNPATKDGKGLSLSDYNMLTGRNNPRSFRRRLNRHRFELRTLTHEQWAYLTNYLNVLTNWTDKESGEVKQYPCLKQNVMVDDKFIAPEDMEWEVQQVFYTRS